MKLPPHGRLAALAAERNRRAFWRKVEEQDNGCWLWTGPVCSSGYGQFSVRNGSHSFEILAHRYAWFLVNGVLLQSSSELHHEKCQPRNTLCVNPSHCAPLTPREHKKLHREQRLESGRMVGICFHRPSKLWRAKLGNQSLGYFHTPEEAHAAYRKAVESSAAVEKWHSSHTQNHLAE
jgi:hypothetical protein